MTEVAKSKNAAWIRVAVDYAAPIAFVSTILITKNFQLATWVLVGASAFALLVGWIAERRLAPLPLMAGGAAVIFGSLTLIFNDSAFVKMKLTIVNTVLAIVLLGGLKLGKNPLKSLLGETLKLPDAAWRTLTVRYALFFLVCAGVNEYVWRTQSDANWGIFRLGLLGAALVFSLTQTPFLMKHMINPDSEPTAPTPPDPGF
jgi:intracellular septation protein